MTLEHATRSFPADLLRAPIVAAIAVSLVSEVTNAPRPQPARLL